MSWIILATLFLPLLAKQIPKQKKLSKELPRQRIERLISFILLLFAAYLYSCFNKSPTNFLVELKCDEHSPTYVLRNSFRTHMSTHHDWMESQANTHDATILAKEILYGKLLAASQRRIYLLFGHDAFVNCSWCKDQSDYSLYIFPEILTSYFYVLVVIGFATIVQRKFFWRIAGPILLCVLLLLEVCLFTLDVKEILGPVHYFKSSIHTPFDDMKTLRLIAMLCLIALVAFWNSTEVWSESEIMQDTVLKTSELYDRKLNINLVRSAVDGSRRLKRKELAYLESLNADKISIRGSHQFKVIQFFNSFTFKVLNDQISDASAKKDKVQAGRINPSWILEDDSDLSDQFENI